MTFNSRHHSGYIFLVSVLVIGAIATTTAVALLLLGWLSEQNGLAVMQSSQAYEYANICTERAIRSLRANAQYAGDEKIVFTSGSCAVLPVGGTGNSDRTICGEGNSGNNVRRIEVVIGALYPTAIITSWQEVSSFTQCP